MAEVHGTLVALSQDLIGDSLVASALSGATTLSLHDVSDFDEDGGQVSVNGVTYVYTSVDMDADTMTLATGLTGSAAVDDLVTMVDPDTGAFASVYSAQVLVDGQADGDALAADVDHALAPLLTPGLRLSGESVSLKQDGNDYRLVAIHGKQASQDALTYMPGGFTTRPDSGGQGIQVSADTAGGVIQFWTGASTETAPGSINPISVFGIKPTLAITSPSSALGVSEILIDPQSVLFSTTTTQVSNDLVVISLQGLGTTSASIDNGGKLIRTPSSRRYKEDVEPLALDDAVKVLDLEPVTFHLKSEAELDGRPTYPGFIAEQAAEVGADLWVNYDAEGKPDGFRYAEVVAALVPIVRDQRDAIARLEARITDLEKGAR